MPESGLFWEKEIIFGTQEEIFSTILGICDKYLIQFNLIQVFIVQLVQAGHNAKSCLQ